ncbi:hypothetical protein CYMTET_7316 [Cymbomonas tetramitiformis]|uniref:Uncharacterized protein n=1 Tax=Cymbomonas tetramitiformis TaxID=36881 RepID=A0AAE0LH47_9CHLO|nr:hypothetical protein CYMTET_7316 [Cymbomonas tetramitiformis]
MGTDSCDDPMPKHYSVLESWVHKNIYRPAPASTAARLDAWQWRRSPGSRSVESVMRYMRRALRSKKAGEIRSALARNRRDGSRRVTFKQDRLREKRDELELPRLRLRYRRFPAHHSPKVPLLRTLCMAWGTLSMAEQAEARCEGAGTPLGHREWEAVGVSCLRGHRKAALGGSTVVDSSLVMDASMRAARDQGRMREMTATPTIGVPASSVSATGTIPGSGGDVPGVPDAWCSLYRVHRFREQAKPPDAATVREELFGELLGTRAPGVEHEPAQHSERPGEDDPRGSASIPDGEPSEPDTDRLKDTPLDGSVKTIWSSGVLQVHGTTAATSVGTDLEPAMAMWILPFEIQVDVVLGGKWLRSLSPVELDYDGHGSVSFARRTMEGELDA